MYELLCVLVKFDDGEECWVVWRDYATNPPRGSFVLTDRRKIITYYSPSSIGA
jgi:hypothetical protein